MPQKLAMRDFLTFKPSEVLENKKYLFECRDEKSETGSSLMVRLEATHAGLINGNARFYRPDRMQASAPNWVKVGYPTKPVLAHHDEDSDPLGRVLRATYIDQSYQYVQEYPIVKDTIFYNTDAKKRYTLFDSIDWIVDNLQPLDEYRGLGYTELGVKITQPEAIRKVFDEEYLTVSVGFDTDQAICSICHQDWAVDDRCEHKMGKMVDKKKAFLISGFMDYHEVSFINFPADPFAGVISKGALKDSLSKMFFMGLSLKDQASHDISSCTDSLDYTADIQVLTPEESKALEGGQMSDEKTITPTPVPEVKKDTAPASASVQEPPKVDLNKLLDEANSTELTSERAFIIKGLVKGYKPIDAKETKLHKRVVSTVNAVIRKNGWVDTTVAPVKAEVERKIATLGDVLRDMSKEARVNYVAQIADQAKAVGIEFTAPDLENVDPLPEWKLEDLTDEADKTYFSDPDKIYEDMMIELAAAVNEKELEMSEKDCQDAKLSTSARKKLKSGTFCGPGRSFPVPDCAHVIAARRLIGRASVSSSTKSKILACVSRKASSMGCGGGKKKDETSDKPIVDQLVESKLLDALEPDKSPKVTKGFIEHLGGLDAEYKKSDPEMHYWMKDAVTALGEKWCAGQSLKFHMKYLAENAKDYIVLPISEHASLQDAIDRGEEDIKKLQASVDSWHGISLTLVESLKDAKATQIVMFRMMTGVQGYQGLTIDQFNEKVKELAKRTRESLEDTLEDVVEQLKGFTAPVKTGSEKSIETARDVKDDPTPTGTTEKPVTTVKDQVELPESILKIKDPSKRRVMENYHRVATAAKK